MERGPLVPMNHKLAPKRAWPGTLNILQTGKATLLKFGTQTEHGQNLPVDHKLRGDIGHVIQFHNLIWDPIIISRFKFGTRIQRGSFVCMDGFCHVVN